MAARSTYWGEAEGITQSPLSPVEVLEEEIPSLTVAGITVVVVIVLLAIGVVFTLGVMLDCRQKKVLENKLRRTKSRRRPVEIDMESEGAGIAEHMEPSGTSNPPATEVVTLNTSPTLTS